ncbi:cytochrome C [Skermanella stibiiresistens SB22]|uniref:Cytochrome C n=1 Tax=Skermanella stibiiresistens SB22 TaxID=1385369 RepID=W9HEW1_9PROT|nr:c-type cytochrome [Skermanella stibiiresistens]EWY42443.1 cytochrome C [Skermanella stibiiresistens SB22]
MKRMIILAPSLLGVMMASLSATAHAADGAEVYETCAACHGEKGEGTDSGPALTGVVGRKAGSASGFRYSPAMKRSGITWDAEQLKAFLANPQAKVKGNRMPFDGVHDEAERDAVVTYLEGLK